MPKYINSRSRLSVITGEGFTDYNYLILEYKVKVFYKTYRWVKVAGIVFHVSDNLAIVEINLFEKYLKDRSKKISHRKLRRLYA